MVDIIQQKQLERLSFQLQEEINTLKTNRSVPKGQISRIERDSQPIIRIISNIIILSDLDILYHAIYNLRNSCNDVLDTSPIPDQIKDILISIKNEAINYLNELNIDINRKNIADKAELKNIEEYISKNLHESNVIKNEIELLKNEVKKYFEITEDTHKSTENITKDFLSTINNSIKKIDDVTEDGLKEIRDHTRELNSSYSNNLTSLSDNGNKLFSNLKHTENEIRQNLLEITENSFKDFKLEIERQILSLDEQIRASRINLISSFSSDLTSSLELNQIKMDEQVEQLKININSTQSEVEKNINKKKDQLDTDIRNEVQQYSKLKLTMEKVFKEKIDTVERKISIITSGVMADQHIKQANTERRVFWFFQLFGFAFLCAAIYAGSAFFSELTNIRIPFFPKPDLVVHVDGGAITSGPSTFLIFLRISMIILLTAPAMYLLKEAALHRHKENIYRQRGIQLATISPYLEELDKEERAAIKKELVTSFFQFHDGKVDTKNVPDFIRDMKEAVSIAKSINSPTPRKKSTILGKGTK